MRTNGIGVSLNALPLDQMRRFAVAMDGAGFHSAWFPEIIFSDALTPMTVIGLETNNLRLGTGIVGPWSRSPVVMAMTLATLSHLCPGRIVLGLGTQARPYVENWHGRDYQKPLRAMREYITILKSILAGELVNYAGQIFRVKDFQLKLPPPEPVPIYMAAIGPKMVQLAGEIADGLLGTLFPIPYVRDVVIPRLKAGAEKSGRSLDGFVVSNSLPTLVTEDDSAFELNRGQVMQFATAEKSSPAYAECVAAAGFADELTAVKEYVAARDFDAALSAIPFEMVDALSLSGTAEQVRTRVAAYHDAGVHIAQALPSPPGVYYPLYEGHLDGATFPEFSFPDFLGGIERLVTQLGST